MIGIAAVWQSGGALAIRTGWDNTGPEKLERAQVQEPDVFDMVIVGAGISGIGMAAHYAEKFPGKRYLLLDRREQPGGTWDLFRYPGVRSDSDMYTLGYKFAPWREDEAIVAGEKIVEYLRRVMDERNIGDHVRYGQHVLGADWDAAAGVWRLDIQQSGGAKADGASAQVAAKFLYMGTGYYDYDVPHDAAIPGLSTFKGQVIHPQFWPENLDYSGKQVVVIGSGATAVTLVPAMAGNAEHVTMLQRTPTWMAVQPAKDALANKLRRWLPEKWAYAINRKRMALLREFVFNRSRSKPAEMAELLTNGIRRQLGNAYVAEDFTPPYGPWEQRMCLVPDGDFFKAMRRGKASVVTGQIERIDESGVLLDDGRRLPADVIVTATGLKLAVLGKVAISMGGEPVNFAEHFQYRDCMFSNVPNFAAMFGYLNTSWTLRVDIVAEWLCRLLRQMDAWHMDVATPALPADHDLIEDQPFDLLSSGYLKRGRHLLPKSSTTAPWQMQMDYRTDRRELAAALIDDGWMAFTRLPRAARAADLAPVPALN
ncbi:MAG: NAD(P)/FAD-dependent oxidoreductase [Novosphingobium sp.]